MGIGAYTLPSISAVTAPTDALRMVITGSTDTDGIVFDRYAQLSVAFIDGVRALFVTDGITPPRVLVEDEILRMGILPPVAAPGATPGGAQATAQLTMGGQPNDADSFILGSGGGNVIVFKTTLVTDPTAAGYPGWQVKIGANLEETIDNITALVNDTAGDGVKYHNTYRALGFPVDTWAANFDVEVSADTATTITFRAISFGTQGNLYHANAVVDGAAAQTWPGTTLAGGTDGAGSAPLEGIYHYIYQYFRKLDGAYSGSSPRVRADVGTAANLAIDTLANSGDGDVSHTVWFRTLQGGGTFYPGDAVPDGTTTDTDDQTDDDLTALGKGLGVYIDGGYRGYAAGHIPRYRYFAVFNNSIFGVGAHKLEDRAVGTIDVTNGSRAFTVNSGIWTDAQEGGSVRVGTDDRFYLIATFDVATQTGNLAETYEGTTASGANYLWRDTRNGDEIGWSEPGKPNQWPAKNTLRGVVTQDDEGATGLHATSEALYIFTRRSIYRLSGTAGGLFTLRQVVEGIGCVEGHTIVEAGGLLYFMSEDGIYQWDFGPAPHNITRPMVQGRHVGGIDTTFKRVNMDMAPLFHGAFNATENHIRWQVALDDDEVPDRWIEFDLQTGALTIGLGQEVSVREEFQTRTGRTIMLAGDRQGRVAHESVGTADGVYGYAPVLAVSSVAGNVITLTTSPLTADDLIGGVAWLKDASGDWERVFICDNATGTITASKPLTGTYASGDQIVLGLPLARFRSGQTTFGETNRKSRVVGAEILYEQQALAGRVYAGSGDDGSALRLPPFGDAYADLTDADGYKRVRVTSHGRYHQFEVVYPLPGAQPTVIEFAPRIAAYADQKANA